MTNESFNPNIAGVQESEEYKNKIAQEKAEQERNLTTWQRFAAFFKNGRTRFATGIILLLLSVYLLISFLSFFMGSGAADQNQVQTNTVIENAAHPDRIANAGKVVGASLLQLLIADGVGVAAFILVVWSVTMGLRLVNVKKGKHTHFFAYTFVTLLSIFACSLLVGAVTYDMNLTFFPLGGYFGHFANKWLLGLTGIYGMIAVNIIVLLIWATVCFNTLKALYVRTRNGLNEGRKFLNNRHAGGEKEPGETTLSDFMGGLRTKHEAPQAETGKTDNVQGDDGQDKTTDKTVKRPARKRPTAPKTEPQNGEDGDVATMNEIETGRVSPPVNTGITASPPSTCWRTARCATAWIARSKRPTRRASAKR